MRLLFRVNVLLSNHCNSLLFVWLSADWPFSLINVTHQHLKLTSLLLCYHFLVIIFEKYSCRRLKGLRYYSLYIFLRGGLGGVTFGLKMIRNILVLIFCWNVTFTKLSWHTNPYLTWLLSLSKVTSVLCLSPYLNRQDFTNPLTCWAVSPCLSWFLPCPSSGIFSLCLSVWEIWLCFRSKMKFHLVSETFPDFLQGRLDHFFFYILLI